MNALAADYGVAHTTRRAATSREQRRQGSCARRTRACGPSGGRQRPRRFARVTYAARIVLVVDPEREEVDAATLEIDSLERTDTRLTFLPRSRQKWWAFEGHTEVDCWLETDRLLLFVEGKRTESLSASTHWYPERNQLVRNLEVVGELADGRRAGVLLVTEEPVDDLTAEAIALSAPHLDEAQRARLWDRYLGQATWRVLCDRLGVDYASLPTTIAEVIAATT